LEKNAKERHITRAKFGIAKINELQGNWSQAFKIANEALISFKN